MSKKKYQAKVRKHPLNSCRSKFEVFTPFGPSPPISGNCVSPDWSFTNIAKPLNLGRFLVFDKIMLGIDLELYYNESKLTHSYNTLGFQ